MSLARYWNSLKASFVGTIVTTLTPKKASEYPPEENYVKPVEVDVVETPVVNEVVPAQESSEEQQQQQPEEKPVETPEVKAVQVDEVVKLKMDKKKEEESKKKEEESSSDEEDGLKDDDADSSSDDEEVLPNHEIAHLQTEAKTCQRCKETYDTAAEASQCLNVHKRVRCYFCFNVYKNTEALFDHFKQQHRNGGRDKFLICAYCDQSIPFKSVSCHVISSHLTENKMGTRSSAPTTSRRSRPNPGTESAPPKKTKQNDGILWVE